MMRRISVVTVGRSDYGILRPVLQCIDEADGLELSLRVGGMHLDPAFGHTVDEIEADGLPISHRVPMPLGGDGPEMITQAIAQSIAGFGASFAEDRPDILLVLGDRYEMYGAAIAALPFRIPVAHIHGGELTLGAIDDALRHSMTKMSHLHFVATDNYARRVRQLGEEPWRITVSGAPSLDNLRELEPLGTRQLSALTGLDLSLPTLLVTFHPVSLEYEDTAIQVAALMSALAEADMQVIFTLPNADTAHRTVVDAINTYLTAHADQARLVENLGTAAYFGLMGAVRAMVGNSSSGLIEAPSFGLPVVNIGNRQKGRVRGANVIDTPPEVAAITAAIKRAVSPAFRRSLDGAGNPYDQGGAAEVITKRLAGVALGARLTAKAFVDIEVPTTDSEGFLGT